MIFDGLSVNAGFGKKGHIAGSYSRVIYGQVYTFDIIGINGRFVRGFREI